MIELTKINDNYFKLDDNNNIVLSKIGLFNTAKLIINTNDYLVNSVWLENSNLTMLVKIDLRIFYFNNLVKIKVSYKNDQDELTFNILDLDKQINLETIKICYPQLNLIVFKIYIK